MSCAKHVQNLNGKFEPISGERINFCASICIKCLHFIPRCIITDCMDISNKKIHEGRKKIFVEKKMGKNTEICNCHQLNTQNIMFYSV